MAARVGWALASAVVGGLWLAAALARGGGTRGRPARLLFGVALAVSGFWAAVWLVLAALRLLYPYELEWCGGAMLDHCRRVLAGEPLYVPPGPGWFPYEYPPLYTWVCAALMWATGGPSFTVMRAVSSLATVGCAAVLYIWARDLIAGRARAGSGTRDPGVGWALMVPGLFLAGYRFTGAWYDVERLDMLFMLLSLMGGWLLERAIVRERQLQAPGRQRSVALAAAAAAILVLAFLTKQQAALFILGGIVGLGAARRWRLLVLFAAISAVGCGVSILLLNRVSSGWFAYYCYHLPMANGIKWHLAGQFLTGDLALFAPLIAIPGAAFGVLAVRRQASGRRPCDAPMLAAFTAMAVAGSLVSRAHWGGDQNVLIPAFVFLALAGCVVAAAIEVQAPGAGACAAFLVLAQLAGLTYRPGAQVPTPEQRAAGARYDALVRALSRGGEVLSLDHGGLTRPSHFQTMALHDVYNADRRLPPELAEALRRRRYSAIVTDARPSAGGAFEDIVREYPHAERIGISQTWTATGFPTPSPERPVWVLTPAASR